MTRSGGSGSKASWRNWPASWPSRRQPARARAIVQLLEGLPRSIRRGVGASQAPCLIAFEKAQRHRDSSQNRLPPLRLFAVPARLRDNAIQTVSSGNSGQVAGVKSTQLRKDLTYFGQFGTRGLGYDVAALSKMISDQLGTTSLQPVILVGVGNLGLALLSYRGFEKEGFEIIAAFDSEPARRRDKELHLPILGMSELPDFVAQHHVKMAILSVPQRWPRK